MKIILFLTYVLFCINCFSQSSSYDDKVHGCIQSTQNLTHFEKVKTFNKCINGTESPNFSGTTTTGEVIELKDLRGHVVVINFWFIACPPCVAEIPGLNDLVKKYESDGVIFLGITRDSSEDLNNFYKTKTPFLFKMIPNNVEIYRNTFKFQSGFPTTIIIDKEGLIRYITSGGRVDKGAGEEIKQKLKPVIKKYLRK